MVLNKSMLNLFEEVVYGGFNWVIEQVREERDDLSMQMNED